MYSLETPLVTVTGIGEKLATTLAQRSLHSVKDALLFVPLRYEDRSQQKHIGDLIVDELVTIEAEVVSFSNQYKGRRSIQRATIQDETGKLAVIWFNTPFLKDSIQKGHSYYFSGKLSDRGQLVQPKVEKVSADTIHTNRLVPVYSAIPSIQPGKLRRLLKHIIDNLNPIADELTAEHFLSLSETFRHLHFPDDQERTIKARERLALEELLGLIHYSHHIKQQWKHTVSAHQVVVDDAVQIPPLPFELTGAQERAIAEIMTDLRSETPMNRLLLGDVGSGKTAVAGIAALHTVDQGFSAALVAPTQILAQQHMATLTKLFPQLSIQVITSKQKKIDSSKPSLFVGTHAVINHFSTIKPALVIYDEQHKFGVKQRSAIQALAFHPHVLTMSATPIPRSLMLTLFSHLELSVLDELPANRKPTKTWVVPEHKRGGAYEWIKKEIATEHCQVLVVCPFIDPSNHDAFENVTAATDMFESVRTAFPQQTVALLHGRLSSQEKDHLTQKLFAREIDIVVTTPIIEVGVDLPGAAIMIIESAERFGMASLHQLRGRVGRAGQQGYCLLFTQAKSGDINKRLHVFSETTDGMKVAEFDLENRGAGNLFGIEQHGFEQLRFASWTNARLIAEARKVYDQLSPLPTWLPFLSIETTTTNTIPLAN